MNLAMCTCSNRPCALSVPCICVLVACRPSLVGWEDWSVCQLWSDLILVQAEVFLC
ncbi:hypothetical protein GCK32_021022, partial [Trichostrongylus colubriformis]